MPEAKAFCIRNYFHTIVHTTYSPRGRTSMHIAALQCRDNEVFTDNQLSLSLSLTSFASFFK